MKRIIFPVIFILAIVSCTKYLEEALESPSPNNGRVTFRFRSLSARTVQIAGDWNNWARGDAESGEVLVGSMVMTGKGEFWELTVELSPGRYRYYFIIDETHRILDPENPRVVNDVWGGKANLLIMP